MKYLNRLSALCLSTALLASSPQAATVTVNQSQTFQTIDGFGAFGAMNVWWSSGPFHNDDFLRLVFDTIGLTLLRTELYPIPDQTNMWTKQVPYLRAVNDYVTRNNIPFKFLASIWSPPGAMKTGGSTTGGQLKTSEIANYGTYVVDYIDRFKTDVGADLHAVSAQNEPALCTGYNSACYLPAELTPILIGVADAMVAARTTTVLHWPDNIRWGGIWEDFSGATASANMRTVGDILSWHYAGIDQTSERTQLARYLEEATGGTRKYRMWNTEFGGYYDDWNGVRKDDTNNDAGDVWTMIQTMFLYLTYGFNAIVWWQLCEPYSANPIYDHYALLHTPLPATMEYRASVMRQFARFIRPQAVRIGASSDNAAVWATAFKHSGDNTVTVVLVNGGAATTASIQGSGLPSSLTAYQTSQGQRCAQIGAFAPGASIALPSKSITTLYNGTATSVVPTPAVRAGVQSAAQATEYGLDGRRFARSADPAHAAMHCVVRRGLGSRTAVVVAPTTGRLR